MEKETIINIAFVLYVFYALSLFIAMLGGGIALSLYPPLYVSPIVFPREAFYGFPVLLVLFCIVVPRGTKSWILGALGIVGGILGLIVSKDPITIALSLVPLIGGIVEILWQTPWVHEQ